MWNRTAPRVAAVVLGLTTLIVAIVAACGGGSVGKGGEASGGSDRSVASAGAADGSAVTTADQTVDAAVPTTPTTPRTPTTPPGPPMTSCTQVVHIGDSTSIGLTSPAYLPNAADRIDAQYARVGVTAFWPEISGARSIVEHLKNQLNAQDVAKRIKASGYEGCWVLTLGTTDSADIAVGSTWDEQERIDKMMAIVGDDPVLWVNVKTLQTSGAWSNLSMAKFDQVLTTNQATYPNLHIFDWSAVAQDGWFTKDKIHYTSSGFAHRAELIADALAAQIPAGG